MKWQLYLKLFELRKNKIRLKLIEKQFKILFNHHTNLKPHDNNNNNNAFQSKMGKVL